MKLHATGKDLKIIEAERLISGSRKIYSCEFTFDESWDGYTVTAVFSTNSSRLVNMAIVDGVCEIPSEVLRPNARIRVGIFGIDGERSRPTTYSDWVTVEQGTDTSGGSAQPPTPSVYEQWMNALDEKHEEWNEQEQARQDAEAARVEAEQAREDLETGYVAQAKAAAETAGSYANMADNAREGAEEAQAAAEAARDTVLSMADGVGATVEYVDRKITEANEYTDEKIAAIPTPDVSGQINEHNTSETAHEDIRDLVDGKANSDHTHTADEINSIAKVATYYPITSGKSADDLLDGFALIPLSSSINAELSAVVGGTFAYVTTMFYSSASATSKRFQVAVSYNSSPQKMAFRIYDSNGWTAWTALYGTNNKPTAADVGALPLAGGTVTGPIQYQTPSKTITPVTVYEGDVNGAAIVIGGGGLTVVGGGESAANLYSTLNSPTSEEVHIAADTILNLHSNCQTVANRKTVQLTAAGALVVPSGTDYTTAKSRNIQASTTDLTAGTSTLASGDIYLVYE